MPRPKSDIDVRILHAARERFLNEGVDGASLRAIAKDARTSIGMVYYYFPSKDDLFLAVVEEVYERVVSELSAALGSDVPVVERIRRRRAHLGGRATPPR
jgi:AcrR family transcriptional regulator